MKIRRVRYVAPYEYEYEPYGGRRRKGWRDWIEVETFDNARVMQLDHNSHWPGSRFMLRVPMTNPVTGTDRDEDGDQALLRVEMLGGEISYIGQYLTFRGFVSKEELEYERAYRAGDLSSRRPASDYEYVREEWQQTR